MIDNTTCVHLLSGGLDSVTMLHDLVSDNIPVFAVGVDYGQTHRNELEQAKLHAIKLGVKYETLVIPPLGGLNSESWIVPNRNSILVNLAVNVAVRARASLVTIGCNSDDAENFPDCRHEWIQATQKCVKLSGYSVEIKAPYIHLSKKKIAAKAQGFGISRRDLLWCYKGDPDGCGTCGACEKMEAAW
jgi:7-cyano-7-deazaguanine synthase